MLVPQKHLPLACLNPLLRHAPSRGGYTGCSTRTPRVISPSKRTSDSLAFSWSTSLCSLCASRAASLKAAMICAFWSSVNAAAARAVRWQLSMCTWSIGLPSMCEEHSLHAIPGRHGMSISTTARTASSQQAIEASAVSVRSFDKWIDHYVMYHDTDIKDTVSIILHMEAT